MKRILALRNVSHQVSLALTMADKIEKTFKFVVVGGGIAGVTCVEQVKY